MGLNQVKRTYSGVYLSQTIRKFNEKAPTINFSVFTMCGRELSAEKTYFWWKLAKRKRIFLNAFHWYDLNRVYHENGENGARGGEGVDMGSQSEGNGHSPARQNYGLKLNPADSICIPESWFKHSVLYNKCVQCVRYILRQTARSKAQLVFSFLKNLNLSHQWLKSDALTWYFQILTLCQCLWTSTVFHESWTTGRHLLFESFAISICGVINFGLGDLEEGEPVW